MSTGEDFPETCMGEWGVVVNFVMIKLGGSLLTSQSHFCPFHHGKSNLIFSRTRIMATVQSLCPFLKPSPVQLLTSSVCFQLHFIAVLWYWGSSWGLHVESPWPWAVQLLGSNGHGQIRHMHHMRAGHRARKNREISPLFPWDYMSLGLGQAKSFYKMTVNFQGFCGFWIGLYSHN